ncbi:MAG: hypothetical protein WAT79_03230 [Saprospiraceae bacterium]
MNRLQQLLEMFEQDPQDSFVHYALAKEYEYEGREEEAIESFLVLKENNPEYIGLYYHLGKLYEKNGHTLDALETYELGIQMARAIKDIHALGELQTAKTNLELGV